MNRVTVELRGGLGNQLFQVCGALTARSMGYTVDVDPTPLEADPKRFLAISALLEALGIAVKSGASMRFSSFRRPRIVLTDPPGEFGDVRRLLAAREGDVILRGYFQDRKNLTSHLQVLSEALQKLPGNCADIPSADLCLHIRRGDYVSERVTSEFHGNLGTDYYVAALKELQLRNQIDSVLVYSDDVDFISQMFVPEVARIFPDISFRSRAEPLNDPLEEVLFLSRHGSHVIANSTFSWWVATLSSSSAVVGPTRWWASAAAPSADGLRWPSWTWM